MKKWLIRILLSIAAIVVGIPAVGILINAVDHQTLTRHERNERLETIKRDWPGNAIDQSDRFMDERNPFIPNSIDLLRWRLSSNPFDGEKRGEVWKVEVKDPTEFFASNDDGIMWLGHATFYIRLGGVGILTDPVFDSPTFFRRVVEVPSQLEKITDVDLVLLSHDHRDHMDEASIRAIAAKFPEATFLGGLRSEDVFRDWTTPKNNVATAGWFQRFDIENAEVKIYFHPVRHWSRRFLLDTNCRLWGSFVIEHGDTKIYFGGDSGFSEHYRELAELHPGIDLFLIGIGAYEPRWFMKPNHNTPAEAVKAFQDAQAATLIPMHYGTFDLSDEPVGQPLRFLLDEAAKAGLTERVKPLAINESLKIE